MCLFITGADLEGGSRCPDPPPHTHTHFIFEIFVDFYKQSKLQVSAGIL